MANEKRSLLSSLFGRGKQQNKEAEEAAELEAKQRLEKRIEQVLAEAAKAPKPVVEEQHAELAIEDAVQSVAEVLPITASVFTRRKTPSNSGFWPGNADIERPHAVNEWR